MSKFSRYCSDETFLTGYQHPGYIQSLAEFGQPWFLPSCKGWILIRRIPGTTHHDAMWPYPLFVCQDWKNLNEDLAEIRRDLISLSLVTDPFGNFSVSELNYMFPDRVIHFKNHYILDLEKQIEEQVSGHHLRYANKAARSLEISIHKETKDLMQDWNRLYSYLIQRHEISGIPVFSKQAFEKQLQLPGSVIFQAKLKNKVVSMLIWYIQGCVAYYHLGASSELGYEKYASFALFWHAIQYFQKQKTIRWLNFGGGSGLKDQEEDGLSRFKKGWSSETRRVYFCGRIFNHSVYHDLVMQSGHQNTAYFPAYREGEFS